MGISSPLAARVTRAGQGDVTGDPRFTFHRASVERHCFRNVCFSSSKTFSACISQSTLDVTFAVSRFGVKDTREDIPTLFRCPGAVALFVFTFVSTSFGETCTGGTDGGASVLAINQHF
jgi:hypothetical protein